jgi:hypothetical protein
VRNRRVALFGRASSVLLSMGLAFVVLSIIPPIPSGGWTEGSGDFLSRSYLMRCYHDVFSPQFGIRVTVESNTSLQLILLDWVRSELVDLIESWMKEQFPGLNETQISRERRKMSFLELFLEANPEHILLRDVLDPDQPYDFFPSRASNVTVVLATPSPDQVLVERVRVEGIATLVPRDRILTPAQLLILFGVPLTLYRIVQGRRKNIRQPTSRSADFHDSSSELVSA